MLKWVLSPHDVPLRQQSSRCVTDVKPRHLGRCPWRDVFQGRNSLCNFKCSFFASSQPASYFHVMFCWYRTLVRSSRWLKVSAFDHFRAGTRICQVKAEWVSYSMDLVWFSGKRWTPSPMIQCDFLPFDWIHFNGISWAYFGQEVHVNESGHDLFCLTHLIPDVRKRGESECGRGQKWWCCLAIFR